MNLDVVKAFIESGDALWKRVNRFKSRVFWLVFVSFMFNLAAAFMVAGQDVDAATWFVVYNLFLIGIFAIKSISTDVRETFVQRSNDRLQEKLAEVEGTVQVAEIEAKCREAVAKIEVEETTP